MLIQCLMQSVLYFPFGISLIICLGANGPTLQEKGYDAFYQKISEAGWVSMCTSFPLCFVYSWFDFFVALRTEYPLDGIYWNGTAYDAGSTTPSFPSMAKYGIRPLILLVSIVDVLFAVY